MTRNTIGQTLFSKARVLPMYSGALLLMVLVSVLYMTVQNDNKQDVAYLQQPKVNDLYVVDFSDFYSNTDSSVKYGIMKVDNVSDTHVLLRPGTLAYNKRTAVTKDIRNKKALESSYYSEDSLRITKQELLEYKASGAIDSVERP